MGADPILQYLPPAAAVVWGVWLCGAPLVAAVGRVRYAHRHARPRFWCRFRIFLSLSLWG